MWTTIYFLSMIVVYTMWLSICGSYMCLSIYGYMCGPLLFLSVNVVAVIGREIVLLCVLAQHLCFAVYICETLQCVLIGMRGEHFQQSLFAPAVTNYN